MAGRKKTLDTPTSYLEELEAVLELLYSVTLDPLVIQHGSAAAVKAARQEYNIAVLKNAEAAKKKKKITPIQFAQLVACLQSSKDRDALMHNYNRERAKAQERAEAQEAARRGAASMVVEEERVHHVAKEFIRHWDESAPELGLSGDAEIPGFEGVAEDVKERLARAGTEVDSRQR